MNTSDSDLLLVSLAPLLLPDRTGMPYHVPRSTGPQPLRESLILLPSVAEGFPIAWPERAPGEYSLPPPDYAHPPTLPPFRRSLSGSSTRPLSSHSDQPPSPPPLLAYPQYPPVDTLYPAKILFGPSQSPQVVQRRVPVVFEGSENTEALRRWVFVFEYEVANEAIAWDYALGIFFLTGLWKCVRGINEGTARIASGPEEFFREYMARDPRAGGSRLPLSHKANIAELLKTAPAEWTPQVRRARGGNIKFQGTWVPMKLARAIARKMCYHIRYCLVPVFGEEFPDECLLPGERGFGRMVMSRQEWAELGEVPLGGFTD